MRALVFFFAALALAASAPAFAHCDTLDGPVVSAPRQAIASGELAPLGRVVSERMEKGLHAHFAEVMAKKRYAPDDVAAGRAYSNAYVEFVHYAERLYDAADSLAPERAEPPATHTH